MWSVATTYSCSPIGHHVIITYRLNLGVHKTGVRCTNVEEQGESTGDLGVPTWRRLDGASRGVHWWWSKGHLLYSLLSFFKSTVILLVLESQRGEGDLMSFFHSALIHIIQNCIILY